MKHYEVLDVLEHVVVAARGGVHLLEDGGDVAEDGGVEKSCRVAKFVVFLNKNFVCVTLIDLSRRSSKKDFQEKLVYS